MREDRVLGVFRFGPRRYIEDFVAGHLHMNTLGYFANVESSKARHDGCEGNSFWIPAEGALLQIEIEGDFQTICSLAGTLRYSSPDDLNTNVFCMYALLASEAAKPIDSRIFDFGDTFAAVLDGDEFFRRVRAAAQNAGRRAEWHLVEYVDKQVHRGRMGIFRKSSEFSYQSECRIALFPGKGSPYNLDIGDVSDLVIVGPTSKLNQRIKLK